MLVHRHHLRAGHELEPGMAVKERLHGGRDSDERDVDPILDRRLRGAPDDLGRRVIAAHGVDRDSHLRTA